MGLCFFGQSHDQRLDKTGNGNDLVKADRQIADPDFYGTQVGVGPNIPPDVFNIFNYSGSIESLQQSLEVLPVFKGVMSCLINCQRRL